MFLCVSDSSWLSTTGSAQSFPLAGSNSGGSYQFGQGLDLQALKFVPPAGSA